MYKRQAEIKDYFQDECITALQSRITTLDRPPPHTAVVYPILLPNRLELLLNSPRGIQQITVPVDRQTFTATVREFRRYLEKRTSREYLPVSYTHLDVYKRQPPASWRPYKHLANP